MRLLFILAFAMAGVALSSTTEADVVTVTSAITRPPLQTTVQKNVAKKWIDPAPTKSSAGMATLSGALNDGTFKSRIGNLASLRNKTAADLMKILRWQFQALPIVHNGATDGHDSFLGDDSSINQVLTSGWIQNMWQRYALKWTATHTPDADFVETTWCGYPPFPLFGPNMDQANDRPLYLAWNIWERNLGNEMFGKVMYTFNPYYWEMLVVGPWDTGSRPLSPVPWGSYHDFYHLIVPMTQSYQFGLGDLFQQWYGNQTSKCSTCQTISCLCYPEIELSANFWMPETLSYMTLGVGPLWGTALGLEARNWLYKHGRPMIWAESARSGMIIDPFASAVRGPTITDADRTLFNKLWASKQSMSSLLSQVGSHLKFKYMSYFNSKARSDCSTTSKDHIVIGANGDDKCVYWVHSHTDAQRVYPTITEEEHHAKHKAAFAWVHEAEV